MYLRDFNYFFYELSEIMSTFFLPFFTPKELASDGSLPFFAFYLTPSSIFTFFYYFLFFLPSFFIAPCATRSDSS